MKTHASVSDGQTMLNNVKFALILCLHSHSIRVFFIALVLRHSYKALNCLLKILTLSGHDRTGKQPPGIDWRLVTITLLQCKDTGEC